MKHVRYDKIKYGLTSSEKGGKKPALAAAARSKWCVTEKVHGANLSIYVSRNRGIKCAKRTQFIDAKDSFFGYHQVVDRFREGILSLAADIFRNDERVSTVILYGELFGGAYPDVESSGHVQPVQVGVSYSPRIEFMLFDICLCRADTEQYLPFRDTIELAEKHDIFYAQPLFIGSRTEAMSYKCEFSSTIPGRLGLPSITLTPNLAEGIVVRSMDQAYSCGSVAEREIIKIKHEDFSEGEGCPASALVDIRHVTAWILGLVNRNRVAAAASKVGSVQDTSSWSDIIDMVIEDVKEEAGDAMDEEGWAVILPQCRNKTHNLLAKSLMGRTTRHEHSVDMLDHNS